MPATLFKAKSRVVLFNLTSFIFTSFSLSNTTFSPAITGLFTLFTTVVMSFVGSSGHSVTLDALSGSHVNVRRHPWVSLPLGDSEDSSYHQGAVPGVPGFPWLSPQAVPAQGEHVSLVNRSGPPEDRESVLLEQSSSISQAQGRSCEYTHPSQCLPAMEDIIINPTAQVSEGCSRSGASSLFNQVLDGSLLRELCHYLLRTDCMK